MKIVKLEDLPCLTTDDTIDRAKAKILETNLPIIVLDSKDNFRGIVDEYAIINNFFKNSELKNILVSPPKLRSGESLYEMITKVKTELARCYPIYQNKKLLGFVLKEDLLFNAKHYFRAKRVRDAMNELITVSADDVLIDIIHKFTHKGFHTVAVLDDKEIIGFIKPYNLFGIVNERLKAIIPSVKAGGKVVRAEELTTEEIAVLDEKGYADKAIDALVSSHYGVVASNGKPVGSISLWSIANSIEELSITNVRIDGLDDEERQYAYLKLRNVFDKVSKTHPILNVQLSVKKKGHHLYVLRLTADDLYLTIDCKDIKKGIYDISKIVKKKYLSSQKCRKKGIM